MYPWISRTLVFGLQFCEKKCGLYMDVYGKPVRMDFPSIFLEDFRGPRKTVFSLKITCLKSAVHHGALLPKSTNFQSLVFIPRTDKLKWKGKT